MGMGSWKWEVGDGRPVRRSLSEDGWKMGDGRWEIGDGRWVMGSGRWVK
jgi:hypothetical protein